MAILAMQVMFGIIVMASANDIEQHKETVRKDYNYHVVLTNLPESGVAQFQNGTIATRIDNYDFIDTNVDGAFVYVTFIPDAAGDTTKNKTVEELFNEFKGKKFAGYVESSVKTELKNQGYKNVDFKIRYETSPLYNLDSDILDMRLSCLIKLLVLALVSIAVIILLFNIRVNHFKFMYGIYMSFGADTKKLFSTSFWEMMMIGVLTLLPAGGIAYGVDFYLYSTANADVDGYLEALPFALSPWLMAFSLLFIIPIFFVAVYVPIKATASKPPLQLLLAEDNSNLVVSPKISTQLIGRKFPKAYENLGLIRFRKYCATLVASSVLFASIFVWISFFRDIYDFDMNQDKAEFVVTARSETRQKEVWQLPANEEDADVTHKYDEVYIKLASGDGSKLTALADKYFTGDYEIVFNDQNLFTFIGLKDGGDNIIDGKFAEEYYNAVKPAYWNYETSSELNEFIKYYNQERFEIRKIKDPDTGITKTKVFKFERTVIEELVYEPLSNEEVDRLETIISSYGGVYKQCVTGAREAESYVAFKKDNVKWFTDYDNAVLEKDFANASGYRAGISIDYYATDEKRAITKYLTDPENGYIIEGDPEMIYDSDEKTRYVIISENAANSKVLDIAPGDEFIVSILDGELKKNTGQVVDQDKYLDRLMREGTSFKHMTFKVCAVIKNMPTSENLPIYFHYDDYKKITGNDVVFNQFHVYVNSSLPAERITDLHNELAEWAQNKANVEWQDAVAEAINNKTRQHLPIIQIIAIFALVLSPLFWFFSQIMFFGKREKEFEILRGMGATEKEVKRIFRKDGIVFSLIGMLSTVVMSVVGVYLIHIINLKIVSRFSVGAKQLYQFRWELFTTGYNGEPTLNIFWVSLAIAVVLTGICGYLSSMIPYIIDKRKAKKRISHEFGE